MDGKIKFPYHGYFTAKRSGKEWHYMVYESGSIGYIEHQYYEHYSGADHLKSKLMYKPTKEVLDDIESKIGKRTDGYCWIDN